MYWEKTCKLADLEHGMQITDSNGQKLELNRFNCFYKTRSICVTLDKT